MEPANNPDFTAPQPLNGLCLAILGAGGGMGRLFARQARLAGAKVLPFNREPAKGCLPLASAADYLPQSQIILSCLPEAALTETLNRLGPGLRPDQILTDITSLKGPAMRIMAEAHPGPVVGTHPLFGPEPAPDDLTVAVTPGHKADEEHIRLIEGLYTAFGCRVFRTTPQEHDRGAAFVQGLNFISSAAYLASLAERADLLPFLTPSFRRRLEGARKLLIEDGDMFQGFTSANPMTKDAVHTFRLFLDLAESGGLPDVLRRARWWYETGGQTAARGGKKD